VKFSRRRLNFLAPACAGATRSKALGVALMIYEYNDSRGFPHHSAELDVWADIISAEAVPQKRAFEMGCGDGSVARALHRLGFDPSESGVAIAREHSPEMAAHVGASDDDLAASFGALQSPDD